MRHASRLLLCLVLYVWQPLNFSVELAATLPTLGMRGLPAAAELIVHGAIAALSVAAASALWSATPAGPRLATIALVGVALSGVQTLYWSRLPHQTTPGDKLPIAALTIAHSALWLLYIRRIAEPKERVK